MSPLFPWKFHSSKTPKHNLSWTSRADWETDSAGVGLGGRKSKEGELVSLTLIKSRQGTKQGRIWPSSLGETRQLELRAISAGNLAGPGSGGGG